MSLKSLKNETKDIIGFVQQQVQNENNSCIDMFIFTDLLNTIKGETNLEIQANKTGITEYVSIKDVHIDTNFNDKFITYKFMLETPFDGEKELTINVSKIERHDQNLYKYYLYDIEQPNKIAYRLEFKEKRN